MKKNYWNAAQELTFQLSGEIVGGFDIGFDSGIPEDIQNTLIRFLYWVEDHYRLPITLWVDFKNRHYLMDQKKRVGYKFYWVAFTNYPVFEKESDIPVIELPAKTGRHTAEEILSSLIAAITHYFAWLCNEHETDFLPDPALTEAILQAYLTGNPL